MVTAYYGKNWGKILRRELLPQFFTNSHEIWHRCLPLGVDVQDTFFDSGRKCVAMVTAYYTVKKYCGAGVLITFSDISSFIHISANMSPIGLKFSQTILPTETSKLIYNWSCLFEVLHKPTLLPSTFKLTAKAYKAQGTCPTIHVLKILFLFLWSVYAGSDFCTARPDFPCHRG